MIRRIQRLYFFGALALWGASLAIGCTQSEQIEGQSDAQLLKSGRVAPEDAAYMRRLAEQNGGKPVAMNLADEAQYRFLLGRVAASGKTPEEYPEVFAMLRRLRTTHQARQQTEAITAQEAPPKDHVVSHFRVHPVTGAFEAGTFTTIKDGGDYSFVDVVVWDNAGTQISDYGWGEDYGDGRKLVARAYGTITPSSNVSAVIDSISMFSVNGVEESFYINEKAVPPGGYIDHPADTNVDGLITICLDRNYGDCDYPLVGERLVKIPLKGRIRYAMEVDHIVNDAATYVKLVEEGGGPHTMQFNSFYSSLRIDPADNKSVIWDIPQNMGVFDGILFTRYQDVDFLLSLHVKLKRPNNTLVDAISKISSIPGGSSNGMPEMKKTQIVWSCLAKGTQIRLGDGTLANIEDISKDTMVSTNSMGLAFSVIDVSTGIERIPMVRIEDDKGHSLLMTESHPVVTPDRGVVWANELVVGSKVQTDDGIATLVKAEREMYSGSVHNLKLDNDGQSTNGSTMYANGILVGDLAMQKAFEFKNKEDHSANVLSRLPTQWHTDYVNSQKHQ
jgi:hypothetical protein